MSKAREFWNVYRLYRQVHSPFYSARIAFGVAVRGLPF